MLIIRQMSASKSGVKRVFCYLIIAMLFGASLATFVFEDLLHPVWPANDLLVPWVSAKAMMNGKNPYNDFGEFDKIWANTGIKSALNCETYRCVLDFYTSCYPPTALAMLTPFEPLSWKAAIYTFLAVSVSLFVVALLILAARMQLSWNDPKKWYFLAFVLAMAPLHGGIHNSNPNTIVISFLMVSVICFARWPYVAGAALAVAFCLKPQVAILFFVYPWLRKRWKTAFTAVAGVIAIGGAIELWMLTHRIAWLGAYRNAIKSVAARGGPDSFEGVETARFYLINLQVLLYQFTHNYHATRYIAAALLLPPFVFAAYLIYTRVSEKNEWLGFAVLATLTLLPVYQRFYGATILLFVLCWALQNWSRRDAKVAVVLLLPALIPLVTIILKVHNVAAFIQNHHLDSNPLWRTVLLPYMIWIDLALVAILLVNMARQPKVRGLLSRLDPIENQAAI